MNELIDMWLDKHGFCIDGLNIKVLSEFAIRDLAWVLCRSQKNACLRESETDYVFHPKFSEIMGAGICEEDYKKELERDERWMS